MFKEFSDPLYGFVRADVRELALIDNLLFQRLRHIKQLGLAYLVFPSAQHTRFEHALGVLHLTDKLYRKVCGDKDRKTYQIVRLAGLLHDLGHPPFSHTTEVLFPDRKTHEDLTKRMILETEIYDILRKVFNLCHEDVEKLIRLTLGEPADREEEFLTKIITGQFGSDRMDYLRRDAFFSGVSYGFFDYERLLSTVETVYCEDSKILAVHISGLRALESFLIGRYFMYTQVYFHKVVRILNIHLIELIKKIFSDKLFTDLETFVRTNDSTVLSIAFSDRSLQEDVERIFGRKHFKEVFSTKDKREFEEVRKELLQLYPAEMLRFNSVYKKPYDENIMIFTGSELKRVEEVSEIARSLKPIEIHSIYADIRIKDEICSLLRRSA